MKISCMIPCYNEQESITETVHELMTEFKKLSHQFEFILIDHASTDSTLEKVTNLHQTYPHNVNVIHLDKNIGYGGIINKSLREYTKGDIIGWTCADGEIKASDTYKLVQLLLEHPQYQAVKATRINRNHGLRKFISEGYNKLVKLLFAINTNDINGWPLFIRAETFKTIDLQLNNWVINIEILHKLQKKKLPWKDLNCEHQNRKGGRSKVNTFTVIEFLYQILAYKISTLTNPENKPKV